MFGCGGGFAGERGLVHLEVFRAVQPHVRGDAVAGLEENNITRHEFIGVDPLAHTRAAHGGLGGDHPGQGLDGPAGA